MNNRYILENISFDEDTSNAINEMIERIFSLTIEKNWMILKVSANKLKLANSQVIYYIKIIKLIYEVYLIKC